MATKMQFDVSMNNSEAMTGTKEIARAMASLQSTVKSVSKGMASSLTGYSAALRKNISETHDYNAEMYKLEKAAAEIRKALSGVKDESVAFTVLKKETKEAEANVAQLTEKLNKLNSTEHASGTPAFEKMEKQVEVLDKKIDDLQSKLAHMKSVRDVMFGSHAYPAKADAAIKSTEKELALAQKERDSLQSKMDTAVDKDINLDSNITEVVFELEKAKSVLEAYNAQRDEMLANGSAYSDQSVVEMTKQLGELEAQLAAMRSAAMETPEFVESVVNGLNEEVDAELTKLSELEQKREELQQAQDEKAIQAFGSESYYDAYQAAYNNISNYVDTNKEEIAALEERAEELRATIEQIRNSGDAANKAFTLEGLEEEYLNAKAKVSEYYDYVAQRAEQLRGHLVKVFGSEEAADEFTSGEKAIGELEAQIEQASEKVDELQDKIDLLTNSGGDLDGKIDLAEQEVTGEKEDIEQASNAPSGNLDSVNDSVKAASSFLDEYMRKWNQMITVSGMVKNAMATAITPILHPIQAADRALGALIVKVGQTAASFARMAGNGALSFLRKLASEAQNAAIQLAKLASNAIHGAFQKLAQGAQAAGKGMLGLIKHNKAAEGSFKRGFMTILKYAFGVRSMYYLFRRLRTAVKEAFTEMAKSSPEVNAAIQQLKTALGGLKGSLASAFAPIFTAVAPALTYLINMLTAAMNALGAFFAALTGKGAYKKAVGAAKSAGSGASKSAKQAKKDVEDLKRELLGFDELNVLNGDNDNNSGGGGGGGGGGGAGFAFVDEEVPSGIKDFVDKLKEFWNNKEYVKIGKMIADWINGAFDHAKELITWENVSEKIQGFVDAVAGILEGLLTYVDWENIGSTISEAFRTITNTIDTFMQKVGLFILAGGALASVINGFFSNKALWTDLAKTITDSVNAFLKFGNAFLDGFNETEAADGIRTALINIPWGDIASDVWEFIKKAFNKAGSFINALLGGDNGEEMPDISKYARQRPETIKPQYKIDESVWDELATTISNGLNDVVSNITDFINNLNPRGAIWAFANWFIRIKNGINWESLGNLIGVSFGKVLDGVNAAITAFADNAATDGANIAHALNTIISTAFKGNTIASAFSAMVKGAFNFIGAFLENFNAETAASELRDAVLSIDWDGIAEAAWNALKLAVSKLGSFLDILFGGSSEPDLSKYARKRPAGMEKQESSQIASIAQGIGKAISEALTKLDEWIKKIDWNEIGAGLKEFLSNLPWDEWAAKLAQALLDLFNGIREFFAGLVFGEEGGKRYKAYARGETTYGGKQYQKAQAGEVSQEFYDEYARLSEQVRQYVENTILSGGFVLNIAQALDVTGWDTFTSETQYAYFLALQESFGADKTYDYLVEKGKEVTAALAEGINSGDITVDEDEYGNAILTFTDGTKKTIEKDSEEIQKLFEQLGVDSVAGLTTAFGSEQENANSAITETMDGIVTAANEAVETGSPSKVFEELGNNIVAGLVNGLNTLPTALQGVWKNLPVWAQNLLTSLSETLGINIKASGNGGNDNNNESVSVDSADTRKNTKAAKKETKETIKNTKELKKNTAKRGEVDVNYEGAGFDTSGDKPKLNIQLGIIPPGEEEPQEDEGGIFGWLQELLDAETLEAKIALIQENWSSVVDWMYDNGYIGDALYQLIQLAKDGDWDSVIAWFEENKLFGPALSQLIKLAKEGKWADVIGWFEDNGFFGPALSQVVELAKQGKWTDVLDWFKKNGYLSENIDQLVQLVKDGDWTGVIDWLTKNNLFGPKLQQLVDLVKNGDWTGVINWLEENKLFGPAVQQLVGLIKDGDWTGVIDWLKNTGLFGPALQQLVGLIKDGNWTGVIDWLKDKGLAGPAFQQLIQLAKDNWDTIADVLGFDPSVKQFVKMLLDLLMGNSDPEAKEVLETEDKDVTVGVEANASGDTDTVLELSEIDEEPTNKKVDTSSNAKGPFEKILELAGLSEDSINKEVNTTSSAKGVPDNVLKVAGITSAKVEKTVNTDSKATGEPEKVMELAGINGSTITKAVNTSSTAGGNPDKVLEVSNVNGTKVEKTVNTASKAAGDPDKVLDVSKVNGTKVEKTVNTSSKASGEPNTVLDVSKVNGTKVEKTVNTSSKAAGDPSTVLDVSKVNGTKVEKTVNTSSKASGDPNKVLDVSKVNGTKVEKTVNTSSKAAGNPDKVLNVSKVKGTKVVKTVNTSSKATGNPDKVLDVSKIKGTKVVKLVNTSSKAAGSPNTVLKVSKITSKGVTKVVNTKSTAQGSPNTVLKVSKIKNKAVTKKVDTKSTAHGSPDKVLKVAGISSSSKTKKVDTNSKAQGEPNKVLDVASISSTKTQKYVYVKAVGQGDFNRVYRVLDASSPIKKTVEVEFKATGDSKAKEAYASGGFITNGGIPHHFASGGIIRGGIAKFLSNVPHYAGGTARAHGTVFIAGEAGPEIMGHINGRTEILNKAQLAQAIYSAVVSGMGAAVNALGKYIANHMSNCTNAIVQTIGATAGFASGVEYYAPSVAKGGVMPYDVAMQIARSTQELKNTLDTNNEELIQAMVSAMGNAAQAIIQAMQTQAMRRDMNRMNSRQVVDDINRAGLMYGQSPIKGV